MSILSMSQRIFGRIATVGRSMSTQESNSPLDLSIRAAKAFAVRPFDETLSLVTCVRVTKKNQHLVRGTVLLPNGTGKTVRVAVFARGLKAEEAKAAGADIVGDQDLIQMIQQGSFEFERCLATPDMMPTLSKVARILGPRGLMPNPKHGTVSVDIAAAVKQAKAGQINYKADKAGVVIVPVGRCSFNNVKVEENVRTMLKELIQSKPPGVSKSGGSYIRNIYLSSTMGPGIPVDVKFIENALKN
eukprot:TRINITY_DN9226_c0_g1_i1.p1 TRINITY_DN9226_c0_g1~~TRINITY_DN9226_c0_g1_i1.p1  ORF type:complete len:245 (-),score=53.36 TRINITY_DN9226_c0_g1_i1:186-920(-)